MREKIEALLRKRPGIKAREIASTLGLEKRDVNVILHGGLSRYRKDSSHGWSIASNRLGISLPGKWTSAADFEQALILGGDALRGPDKEVVIYLPHGCSPMIDCTARLLSLANQLARIEKDVTLDFSQCLDAHSYLDRAGFFEQLDPRVVVLPKRPVLSAASIYAGQSNTMVEFGSVDPLSSNEALVHKLTDKFVQHSSEDYTVAALTVFGEFIRNVAEHSKSPLAGFAGLQKYKMGRRRTHIQTVVSDSGVGIAATLRPALRSHYPALHQKYGEGGLESDLGLVTAALLKGRISSSGKEHGLGFKSSRELAHKHRAIITLRQEHFCIQLNLQGELVRAVPQKNIRPILGTHICFDFYVD